MSAELAKRDEPYEVIHLGDQEAAIVPVDDLRRFQAIARHAPTDALEAAALEEAAEIRRQTDDWIARGRPGARSHADFMNELLAPSGGWVPPAGSLCRSPGQTRRGRPRSVTRVTRTACARLRTRSTNLQVTPSRRSRPAFTMVSTTGSALASTGSSTRWTGT